MILASVEHTDQFRSDFRSYYALIDYEAADQTKVFMRSSVFLFSGFAVILTLLFLLPLLPTCHPILLSNVSSRWMAARSKLPIDLNCVSIRERIHLIETFLNIVFSVIYVDFIFCFTFYLRYSLPIFTLSPRFFSTWNKKEINLHVSFQSSQRSEVWEVNYKLYLYWEIYYNMVINLSVFSNSVDKGCEGSRKWKEKMLWSQWICLIHFPLFLHIFTLNSLYYSHYFPSLHASLVLSLSLSLSISKQRKNMINVMIVMWPYFSLKRHKSIHVFQDFTG